MVNNDYINNNNISPNEGKIFTIHIVCHHRVCHGEELDMSVANAALHQTAGPRKKTSKSAKKNLSKEDAEIVSNLESLKMDLNYMHNSLNYITDPILIDSCIYEILSIHMRYKYYLNLCKEKGLVADWF